MREEQRQANTISAALRTTAIFEAIWRLTQLPSPCIAMLPINQRGKRQIYVNISHLALDAV